MEYRVARKSILWDLLPGVLAAAVIFYRFPGNEPLHLQELAHYLSAAVRVQLGETPSVDFKFMFGPGLLELIVGWMGVFGSSVGSLHSFFVTGWQVYLLLFGVCLMRCSASLGASALIATLFAAFWLPPYAVLLSWGGPRYVPGLLLLALGLHAIRADSKLARQAALMTLAASAPFCVLVSPEQSIVALAALGIPLASSKHRKQVGAWLVDNSAGLVLIVFLLSVSIGLVEYLGFRATLFSYLSDLPAFRAWRQPLTPLGKSRILFALPMLGLAAAAWRMALGRAKEAYTASTTAAIAVIGVWTLLQVVYAARAFHQAQGVMAMGFVVSFSALVAYDLGRSSRLKRLALTFGVSLITVTVLSRLDSGYGVYLRWRANIVGRSVNCTSGCRESALEALKGVVMPTHQVEELEAVVGFAKQEWSLQSDSSIFVFPEDGVFEFLLWRPSVGGFPIAVLAHTRPEWRAALLTALTESPPHLIVRRKKIGLFAQSVGATTELLPEIQKFINDGYLPIQSTARFEILRRTD